MGLLTGFDHDIFVSFAHADNTGDESDYREGWVGATVSRLEGLLRKSLDHHIKQTGRDLDIFWDLHLRQDRVLEGELKAHVEGSATFLAVLSDHYLRSEWCLEKEMRWFSEALKRRDASAVYDPIVPIYVAPLERHERPGDIRDIPGLIFYHTDRNVRNGDPRFNYPSPIACKNDNDKFSKEMNTLQFGFQERFVRALKEESVQKPVQRAPKQSVKSVHGRPVLLLATDDMQQEKELVASCCNGAGHHIVAEDTDVTEVLEGKGMVVSLLGCAPPSDQLIRGFQHAGDVPSNDNVIFWADPEHDLTLMSQLPARKYGTYSSLIDALATKIWQVHSTELEERVVQFLTKTDSPVSVAIGKSTRVRLYIDAEPDDYQVAVRFAETFDREDVREELHARNIVVRTFHPNSSDDQSKIMQRFEKWVPRSEGVILVYGNIEEETIDFKIDDIHEMNANHDNGGSSSVSLAMLLGPPRSDEDYKDMSFEEVIKQKSWDELDVPKILDFVRRLAERKTENRQAAAT